MIYVKSLKAFDLRKLIHVKTRAFFFFIYNLFYTFFITCIAPETNSASIHNSVHLPL